MLLLLPLLLHKSAPVITPALQKVCTALKAVIIVIKAKGGLQTVARGEIILQASAIACGIKGIKYRVGNGARGLLIHIIAKV